MIRPMKQHVRRGLTGLGGFTVAELVIVVVVMGVLMGIMAPRIGRALVQQSVRSARGGVVSMHATAKAAAVQRSTRTVLVLSGGSLVIRAPHPVIPGQVDTVGSPLNVPTRYGVTLTTSRDSLMFDPRGIGIEAGPTTVIVQKGEFADTVSISAAGRVLR